MNLISTKKILEDLLNKANVTINGPNPWDIQVHDERLFNVVLSEGSLGLGEAYMEGWWSSKSLDDCISKILSTRLENKVINNFQVMIGSFYARVINMQSKKRSQRVANVHYNLDNELYRDMLGSSMSYTCAYWKNANTLDEAQHNKHDLVCRKLGLQAGDKVLELGCGWGSFAKYADGS